MAKSETKQTAPKPVKEIERRFLVRAIDPDVRRSPSCFIEQGYFEKTKDLRVRITDGKEPQLLRKIGRGLERTEVRDPDITLGSARFLYESTPYILQKRRYLRDGWEVDFFQGPLTGLVLSEFEMKRRDQVICIPKWMKDCVEVTETLSNRLLAYIAYDLTCEDGELQRPIRDYLPKRAPSIVLTGAPCSGKSTLMRLFRKELGKLLHCVPETATIIIDNVGVKPPFDDRAGMRTFQRQIYRVQHSFEKVSHQQVFRDDKAALLLDRGTVDGAAYMPKGLKDLERVCQTTTEEEYARYDCVICLDLPPRKVYEEHKKNNKARKETYEQSKELRDNILSVWGDHPDFNYVRGSTWEEKVDGARKALMKCIARSGK